MRKILPVLAVIAAIPATAQWTLQNSNTTADLRGIYNVGEGVAWASGTNGTVLRTEDGGYLWQSCSIPRGAEKLDFRGIQAFDANTAIVMSSGPGDQSRLYKTTDGCQSWKLLFTNPDKDGFWDAVNVWRYDHVYPKKPATINGYILGDPVDGQFRFFRFSCGYLISAVKGPWPEAHLTAEPDVSLKTTGSQRAAFAASNSALLTIPWTSKDGKDLGNGSVWPFSYFFVTGGSDGAYVYTPRPGEGVEYSPQWTASELPLGDHTETSGAFAAAADKVRGAAIVVGGDYKRPDESKATATFTIDGGKTWLPSTTEPHGYRSAVAYDSATKTWITVGPNGTDISSDDGRNWRPVRPNAALHEAPDADRNWNALSLPYVVGPHGRIGKLNPAALNERTP